MLDNVEEIEKYQLTGRGEIIQKLRQLGKSNSMITAYFAGGEYSLLTVVVDVLAEQSLLVLDYGANEAMNSNLISSNRAVLTTNHKGIRAQFVITNIKKARLKGKDCFACAIPTALTWVQRREFFRVRVPMSEPASLEINFDENSRQTFPVLDISLGGLAILNTSNDNLEFDAGYILNSCKLHISSFVDSYVSLEIRNLIQLGEDRNSKVRIGCQFINLDSQLSMDIQKFIHHVEALLKRVDD